MMQISPRPTATPTPAPLVPSFAEVTIALEINDSSYLLDDGRMAQQALSCLLKPAQGDRVLVASCRPEETYIVHLLQRPRSKAACIQLPGIEQLSVLQARIELNASQNLALRALGDVEVTASTGVLQLSARNLFTTVQESLVQNVRHFIGQAEQYLLDVKQVLRLHGKQASVTAEHDVKIDAERISMG